MALRSSGEAVVNRHFHVLDNALPSRPLSSVSVTYSRTDNRRWSKRSENNEGNEKKTRTYLRPGPNEQPIPFPHAFQKFLPTASPFLLFLLSLFSVPRPPHRILFTPPLRRDPIPLQKPRQPALAPLRPLLRPLRPRDQTASARKDVSQEVRRGGEGGDCEEGTGEEGAGQEGACEKGSAQEEGRSRITP